MSPGLTATELLGIAALAVVIFLSALAVLAWVSPLDCGGESGGEDESGDGPKAKLVRHPSRHDVRYQQGGAEAVQHMHHHRSSRTSGSTASRSSQSPTIRNHSRRSTPCEMNDLRLMEDLERKRIRLSWDSLEHEDSNVLPLSGAFTSKVKSIEEPMEPKSQTTRCKLNIELRRSTRLDVPRGERGRHKVGSSSAQSTSPGPRLKSNVLPQDRRCKPAQVARRIRCVDSDPDRTTAHNSPSPARGNSSRSPVRHRSHRMSRYKIASGTVSA